MRLNYVLFLNGIEAIYANHRIIELKSHHHKASPFTNGLKALQVFDLQRVSV